MSERLKIIKPDKKFEIIGISDETLLKVIEPIEEGGITLETREDLTRLVEPPLLEACQILFDKNIRTVMSSANKKDKGGKAHIIISFDELNEQNQQIANKLGTVYDYIGKKYAKIEPPLLITEQTTVGEIRKSALELVSKFEQQ